MRDFPTTSTSECHLASSAILKAYLLLALSVLPSAILMPHGFGGFKYGTHIVPGLSHIFSCIYLARFLYYHQHFPAFHCYFTFSGSLIRNCPSHEESIFTNCK
ncbi:hypothetical protein SRHO_G00081150 [Serrasalmus rhombeus]